MSTVRSVMLNILWLGRLGLSGLYRAARPISPNSREGSDSWQFLAFQEL